MRKQRRLLFTALGLVAFAVIAYLSAAPALTAAGVFLVREEGPAPADAAVVLSTGAEYYPRLMEAASLFREGYVERIVINGNRKTEALRELEKMGYVSCCPWYEDSVRILSVLGVPRKNVVAVGAEDAYDTVSEAAAVGNELVRRDIRSIILVTSKFHTRRARFIWRRSFSDRLSIRTVGARRDPYAPAGWWREGRQIRWLLAEYGAWLYYCWKAGLGPG